ncbi:hypothetical protein FB45DRAFT_316828 [Roridomyces roridus]|uniref:Cytochrome P450 n=1 Tax=Roridomyces roridus TaxID=1738132 RepID=A0AAD7FCA9_9AGAR|nr:hypothetical protein FB45DRAFT_316828 [Roridomyces roridus]
MLNLFAAVSTVFLLLFVLFVVRRRSPIYHQTVANVRLLLDPPDVSKEALLRSRALPNARLRAAFQLTNTFVSGDAAIHSEFVHKSLTLLRAAKQDWGRFLYVVDRAVNLALPQSSVQFQTFIRAVTLRAIIVGVLAPDTDITALAANDIDVVAELITELWIRSKDAGHIPKDLLFSLNMHLRNLIPNHILYPNPLDFIIPTWETLWRVVAVTVAHVYRDEEALCVFRDLRARPTIEQFRASGLAGRSPVVEDYINESLRLFPPVRHIKRRSSLLPRAAAAFLSSGSQTEDVADIERAQRTASWGSQPEMYEPMRFVRDPQLAKQILAFGCGPLMCKAANWAPMAAGLIVAGVVSGVDGMDYRVVRGKPIGGGREGWDGWKVEF